MTKAHDAALKTFQGRAVQRAAFAFIFAALLSGAGAARAQTNDAPADVVETARTPAGELSLVRRRDADDAETILVKLDGNTIAEKRASGEGDAYVTASFYGLYPKAAPRYILLELTVGARICAAKFAVIDLTRRGAARVSRDIGNCAMPRVAYRRDALTITFPAGPRKREPGDYYVGPGQVWTYSNGRLSKAGGRR
jgi:hypothetical protein